MSSRKMSERDIEEFVDFHQSYVSQYIALADLKAQISLAILGGFLVFLSSYGLPFQKMKCGPYEWFHALSDAGIVIQILSCLFFIDVFRPRSNSSDSGLVYFGSVAKFESARQYYECLRDSSLSSVLEARAAHCYDLSKISTRKYDNLGIGIWLGLVGVFLTLPAIALR